MRSSFGTFKQRAVILRKAGKTYGEIRKIIGKEIPKSTLSLWLSKTHLSFVQRSKLNKSAEENMKRGRRIAFATKQLQREKYFEVIRKRIMHLRGVIRNKNVAKIALAMLYLGEGSKTQRGFLIFGNSSPTIIGLFMRLLRYCYNVNESRLRCTVQCRADQNIQQLERHWSHITQIPHKQFYKSRIDPRTIGKPSIKQDYKGVCRIDYFSADTFNEIMTIIDVIAGR